MFSLIKFHNDKYYVVPFKNVQEVVNNTCTVKFKGGKYSAFLIKKNGEKHKLLEVKRKKEEQLSNLIKNENDLQQNKRYLQNSTSSVHLSSYNSDIINSHLNINNPSSNSSSLQDVSSSLNDTAKVKEKTNISKTHDVISAAISPSNNTREKTVNYSLNKKKQPSNSSSTIEQIAKELPQSSTFFKTTSRVYLNSTTLSEISFIPQTLTNIVSEHVKDPLESSIEENYGIDSVHVPHYIEEVVVPYSKSSDQIEIELPETSAYSNSTETLHKNNISNIFDAVSPAMFSSNNTRDETVNSSPNNTKQLSSTIDIIEKELPQASTFSNNTLTIHHNSTTLSEVGVSLQTFTDTGSEYVPDASTIETSIEKNCSIDAVDMPINVKEVVVPYSKSSKKHFCIFCKTLQCKIARHLFTKHMNENDVRRASGLPKKDKERLKIINNLRKKGDFLHNTSANYNSGVLIVSRQQQRRCKNNVDDYVCCKHCKGFFSKRASRYHISLCGKSKGKRSNFIESRQLTQYIHSAANHILRTKIFPILRNDEAVQSIRYDELAIKFGNREAGKYTQHQHDMIRAHLRLLGRFKIQMKKSDPSVHELKDIFKPNMFDKCISALRIVANWDETSVLFKTPAVAQNLTCLIKKCGKMQAAECIKTGQADLKTEVDNFLLLWDNEIPTLINKKAVEDLSNNKRIKKVVLPSIEDIKKLNFYLKEKIINCLENLSNTFCITTWTELTQATLIFVQIFNRRRAGEIERLTIENFEAKEIITDNIDKNVLKNISRNTIKFAKQYTRITLRGKLGRTVSVLLCPLCSKAIDTILKYRRKAGISSENHYIFSKQTSSSLSKQYHRACVLIKMFSQECGAKIPQSLRGTTLRKHIATYASLQNIEEASVDKLANFMGHHKDIHKSIYRMSVPVAEITCVSKLLKAAAGDEIEDEVEDDSDEDEGKEGEEEGIIDESKNSNSSSSKKRRSTSPYGKTKRTRWSIDEKQAINLAFGDLLILNKPPSLMECSRAIIQSPALKNRTPQQIKSWIHNQQRCKLDYKK